MPSDNKIDETAARWFLRLREVAEDAPERMEFERWLMANPAHQHAFAEISGTWNLMDKREDLQNMATAIKQKHSLDNKARQQNVRKHLTKLAMVGLIGLATLFAFNQYQVWQAAPVMQLAKSNPVGRITVQTLDDGSQVTLSANSDMQVTYYRHQRHIQLNHGEAIFEVIKDADRPFVVETDTAKVTVLGTRFAVNKLSKLVRISVDHGRVQVESKQPQHTLILTNNQVAEIANAHSPYLVNRNAADAFSFVQGKLVFDKADLHELAETISRYRTKPVVVEGKNSKAEITAVIQIKDAEQFLQGLPNIAPVQISQTEQHALIKSR